MQLDRLAVTLRLRNPWEAMDLGFAMVRTWMREVYAPWLTVFVPLCLVAALILPPQWAVVLVWWLKPALDRIVLHVLANGVFGDLPRLRETLKALPHALVPGLLTSLTLFRFFLARSFNLPVWQLERQRGRAARQRRQQLQRRTGSYAVWLTVACLQFEVALALSVIGIYDLLAPVSSATGFDFFKLMLGPDERVRQWTFAAIYFTVITIVEPCYVAAGFALYLNRRTALEGWDLEVALRRIGERMQTRTRTAGPSAATTALVTLAVVVSLLALPPAPGWAQVVEPTASAPVPQSAPVQPPEERAGKEIKEILKRPEFEQYREQTVLQYLGKQEEKKKKPMEFDSPLLTTIIEALAQLLRVAVWIGLGVAIAFLLYYLLRRLGWLEALFGGRRKGQYVPPDTLFGLDVRPESLPDDIATAALQLARAGEPLKAISLLYRGALTTLLHRDGVELVGGDTEDDCLHKSMGRIQPPAHNYFAHLLSTWQRLAYARRNVPLGEIEGLCTGWGAYFGQATP